MFLPKITEGIKEITSQSMDKVIPNEALQTSEKGLTCSSPIGHESSTYEAIMLFTRSMMPRRCKYKSSWFICFSSMQRSSLFIINTGFIRS